MKNINIQKLHNIKKADEHTHTGIYEGERKDGKIHGYGTYTYTNGTKYVGYWKENTMHGEGTLNWASCEKYIGNWKMMKNMVMVYILGQMGNIKTFTNLYFNINQYNNLFI